MWIPFFLFFLYSIYLKTFSEYIYLTNRALKSDELPIVRLSNNI